MNTHKTARNMLLRAFDLGITHFDLANNYGPPPGSAEETFSAVLRRDLRMYRDELVISSKTGYHMWNGPYNDNNSRKYLVASLDQSLHRLSIDYVDIFYHHRPDPETPLEETISALDHLVRSGKALYADVSNYPAPLMQRAARIFRELSTPCLIHQPSYSMFNRWIKNDLLQVLADEGIGCIAFSPLAQGLLTNKYLTNIPDDSRAAKPHGFLRSDQVTEATLQKVKQLDAIARERGQTLAQIALMWVLRHPGMTSALIGASHIAQIENAVRALERPSFGADELANIDRVLAG